MFSVKIRIYLFYVAALFFAAIGLWLLGRGLFGNGGLQSLIIGGLMFATGVVDYAMGSHLQRIYLQQSAPAPAANDTQAGSPGGNAG